MDQFHKIVEGQNVSVHIRPRFPPMFAVAGGKEVTWPPEKGSAGSATVCPLTKDGSMRATAIGRRSVRPTGAERREWMGMVEWDYHQ